MAVEQALFPEADVRWIRDRLREIDKTCVPDPAVLDYCYEHRLFKLFVPDALGGRMTPLPEALRWFEAAARIDGSFGWLVTIGSGGGYFAAYMEPAVAERVFADRNAVIAGSGTPTGTARRTEGGYRVSGRWKYCSGSTHATAFTANAVVENDARAADGTPSIRSFIFHPRQVTVVRDWDAFGMKGTESHTIVVEDAFVPDIMTFRLEELKAYKEEPIYRYPFVTFAETSFAAVCIGLAARYLDEAEHRIRGRLSDQPERLDYVAAQVRRCRDRLDRHIDAFYDVVNRSWELHVQGGVWPSGLSERISSVCKAVTRQAVACSETLFPYLGMAGLFERDPLNRVFRDLHTAAQHAMLVPYREEEVALT